MKVSSSSVAKATATSTKFSNHILPLIEIKEDDEDTRDYTRFKLRSDPTKPDSPQYTFNLKVLNNESTLRQAIVYSKEALLVCTGLGVNLDAMASLAIINRTTKDQVNGTVNNHVNGLQEREWKKLKTFAVNALPRTRAVAFQAEVLHVAPSPEVAFQSEVLNQDGSVRTAEVPFVAEVFEVHAVPEIPFQPERPTPAEIQACADSVTIPAVHIDWVHSSVNAIVTMIAPTKALALAKRQLRREVRKPSSMTIRQFVNRIRTINDVEMKRLPPFEQNLERDEILEILYHAIPSNWRSEMERQGFDHSTSTATAFIIFCERLELAATHENSSMKVQSSTKNKGSSGKTKSYSKDSSKSTPSGDFYCKIHGADKGHNTDKCYTLQNMLDKQNGDGKHKNKTWKKGESNHVQKKGKAKAHKAAVQKEINMLIKKGVLKKNPKKKDSKKSSKKRKNYSSSSDEESDSEGSVNMMDEVDLSEFNYDDMDNLKIESDDETMSYKSTTSK